MLTEYMKKTVRSGLNPLEEISEKKTEQHHALDALVSPNEYIQMGEFVHSFRRILPTCSPWY